MGVLDFFVPTKKKVVLFIVMILLMCVIFSFVDLRVFDCYAQPVVPNPPAPLNSVCPSPFLVLVGSSTSYTLLGLIELMFVFLVIPYLLASLVTHFWE